MRHAVASAVLVVVAVLLPGAARAAPGDLDPSFGNGGIVTTDLGGPGDAWAIAIQGNGKIVAGGKAQGTGSLDFALVRYTPDGNLDPVFDGDGRVTTDFGGQERVHGLAIQSNGRVVAAGWTGVGDDFAVARYRRDGGLDTSFGGDGTVTTDFGGSEGARDVVIQPDGRIVVAGSSVTDAFAGNFVLARYNPDGSLDASFGSDGRVTTDFGAPSELFGAALESNGRIVVVGYATPLGVDAALARYNSDGTLDTSFDGDGKIVADLGEGEGDALLDLAIQGDGSIVVAGAVDPPGQGTDGSDFVLARFNADGILDPQGVDPYLDAPFGTDGVVRTDFAGGEDEAHAMAIESGGKIVVAGVAPPGDGLPGDFALARYKADGSLDESFGSGGRVTTDFGSDTDEIWDVALQADGAIVAAGRADSAGLQFAVARYLTAPCCVVGVGSAGVPLSGAP
jgi:uncharacterized delta-60 repeat protein